MTWYDDAGLTTPVVSPTNATVSNGQVFYVLVDNGTCSDTAMVTYTVTSTITLTDPLPILCEDAVGSGNVTGIDLTSYNSTVYSGGAATFDWYSDAGLTTPVGTPTNVTASNGTIFYVDVTDGNCNNNTTLTFTVNAQSTGTVDSTVCNGGSVTVNGTVYSSATSLTGTEVFTAANNCDSTVTVTITELAAITGTLDSTVCNGASFVFNGTTYDATNTSGTEMLTAASGCDSTVTVTVTVNPSLSATPDVIAPICLGDPLTLTATASGSGTITWYDTDGVTVIGTGSPFDATAYAAATGTYTFYVSEEGPCASSLTPVNVLVGGVTADINADPTTGFVPLEVTFTIGSSSTGTGIIYTWNFGDGSGDVVMTPAPHTYNDIDTYIASLVVSDAAGCADTAYVTIEVIGESTILIPNVFTPNNDGQNDVFTVKGTNLESVTGQIFNRWGQKMFEWDGVKGYWDGRTLSGNEVPDGTYFYIITAKGFDGAEYFKKGGFSLIR